MLNFKHTSDEAAGIRRPLKIYPYIVIKKLTEGYGTVAEFSAYVVHSLFYGVGFFFGSGSALAV